MQWVDYGVLFTYASMRETSADMAIRSDHLPKSAMQVSVIIPCGRPDKAVPLVRMLQSQQLPAGYSIEIAIVVVDVDADTVSNLGCKVVSVTSLQPPGRMRNLGAQTACGSILAFIDDDCLPPDNWLAALTATLLEAPRCAAVGCRLVCSSIGFWNECADFALFWSYQYPTKRKTDLGSAAMVVQREAFQEAGGFDEKLKATEDWDFCLRVRAMGWHCVHDPSVAVLHDHRRGSLTAIVKQGYHSGYLSGLDVQRKHASQMTWLARLSLLMGDPWLYWLLILPNACLNTALQVLPFLKTRLKIMVFSPFILLTRLAYHIGVWWRLLQDLRYRRESEV